MTTPPPGSILWHDLTVPDATRLRDFYQHVTGWSPSPVPMGGYDDYCMNTPDGATAAGICHARGQNASIPPQWLVYITVPDVLESAKRCTDLGGKILDGPRPISGKLFCVIQDPAGAVAALIES